MGGCINSAACLSPSPLKGISLTPLVVATPNNLSWRPAHTSTPLVDDPPPATIPFHNDLILTALQFTPAAFRPYFPPIALRKLVLCQLVQRRKPSLQSKYGFFRHSSNISSARLDFAPHLCIICSLANVACPRRHLCTLSSVGRAPDS